MPRRAPVRRRRVAVTPETAPRPDLLIRARDIDSAAFSRVTGSGNPKQARLWNEYIFEAAGTKKTMLLYPLVKDAARQLRTH